MHVGRTSEPTVSFVDRNPSIYLYLENGLYFFVGNSATGKTWLLKNLQSVFEGSGEAFGYTYTDFLAGNTVDAAKKDCCKVTLFDRYDMYNGAFKEEILELAQKQIVLVDCKIPPKFGVPPRFCSILLPSAREIIVR